MTDIRFRGERIVYELALMDAQAIYGGAVRDQFMSLEQKTDRTNLGLGGGLDAWRWLDAESMTVLCVKLLLSLVLKFFVKCCR